MTHEADPHRGRWAFGLTLTAFGYALALVVAAFVAPVYSTSSGTGSGTETLVGENGLGVLVPVAAPAAVTALVWLALHRKCSRGSRGGAVMASVLVALLAAFCLLAALTIGVFVLPVALLLGVATTLTPTGARA
jgi:hypothetical protein